MRVYRFRHFGAAVPGAAPRKSGRALRANYARMASEEEVYPMGGSRASRYKRSRRRGGKGPRRGYRCREARVNAAARLDGVRMTVSGGSTGRTALVTGAAAGIGRACAQ